MPPRLDATARVSLVLAAISAVIIVIDLASGRRQRMWIMNVVWPVTALWSGPIGLWGYLRWGRAGSREAAERAERRGEEPPSVRQPFAVLTGKGTTHCGAGCTLGDIAAGWLAVAVPLSIFGHRIFGEWVYGFVLAYLLGVGFQYFTIAPMRGLSVKDGIVAAVKADTLSLVAWQLGMYGFMAIARFVIFGHELPRDSSSFWFLMQMAMFLGFATSYPVNWWLLKRGLKEKM